MKNGYPKLGEIINKDNAEICSVVLLFWIAAYISLHSLYGYIKTYQNLIK